ncbi:MAG: xanthine dehydrogenase, partial [Chloroflexi bacterium]
MSNHVTFYLNGKAVSIENPAPDLLLIDYLRSPDVALAGPKKPCGEGGCGGCTVILSRWNEVKNEPEHRAINSCLRPVCALSGLVVTTVEGTGAVRKPDAKYLHHTLTTSRNAAPIGGHKSPVIHEAKTAVAAKRKSVRDAVRAKLAKQDTSTSLKLVDKVAKHPSEHSHEGMNPVAHRLAINNGSQCGYCSVGFVMNMSEFITNNPQATKKEIEEAFDGNLCRCTGYRSILTGMKTFASDWSGEDEKHRMKCLEDDVHSSQLPTGVAIPFPKEPRLTVEPVESQSDRHQWLTPSSLSELAQIMTAYSGEKFRLVHGNTSFGVYKTEYPDTKLFIDIRLIPELHEWDKVVDDQLIIGAGTTYNKFIDLLAVQMEFNQTTTLSALDFMARRTAGRIVRNAASLGGNTMLVLKHLAKHTGDPFPSDLFTVLVAIDAKITFLVLVSNGEFEHVTLTAGELVNEVLKDSDLADRIVLLSYALPLGRDRDVVLAQKVALREVNSHSIVNATTRLTFSEKCHVENAELVFSGIAPFPWHAHDTESAMQDEELTLDNIGMLLDILADEVRAQLRHWRERMEEVPNEGFTEEYRTQLAVAFFYKAIINALVARGAKVPANLQSSGEVKWGNWPVSNGTQHYSKQKFKAPVAQPYIKNTAMYQTSGQLHYTHELAVPPLTANGALVQSLRALANFRFVIPDSDTKGVSPSVLRKYLSEYASSFIDLITVENIKNGGINLQGMGLDQPLYANKMVSYVGQSIAMVLATTEQEAIRIAEHVTEHCVAYSAPEKPWTGKWSDPIIDLLDAIEKGSIFPDAPKAVPYVSHIWKITRPGSQFDWVLEKNPLDRTIPEPRNGTVGSAPCVIVESTQLNGGQAHFYMEPQGCIAIPTDE